MTPSGLNLEQAPPFSVPLRFILTAPVFALLAALMALWQGPDLLDSRWMPATLAATHLLTLGFMSMVMIGAMMQILPVLAGAVVPLPRLVAGIVHGGLTLGTLGLAGGFLLSEDLLLKTGLVILGIGFAVFLAAVSTALARVRVVNIAVRVLRLVMLALTVTAILGLWLSAGRAWGVTLPNASMRDLHPGWGLLGWTGLLVIGAAYHVVPMFQMTPSYPAWMQRWLAFAILGLLLLWSIAAWESLSVPVIAGSSVLAAFYAGFAAITLRLQQRRRRRQADVTLLFWRTGMLSVLLAAVVWAGTPLIGPLQSKAPLFVGVLAIVGAAMSVITGMLYKIVPFLAWFHLQAQTGMGRRVPNMKQYLSDSLQRRQYWLHVGSLLLLLAAIVLPKFLFYPAAFVFGVSSGQLLWNLFCAWRTYRRHAVLLAAAAR